MFIAQESFRSPTSQLFAQLGESHFSAAELALEVIWFVVACITSETHEGETYRFRRTLLLAYPEQVRAFLEAESEVIDIHIVTPNHVNGTAGWRMDLLTKVWNANEPKEKAAYTYVFETEAGHRYSNSAVGTPVEQLLVGDLFFELPVKTPSTGTISNPHQADTSYSNDAHKDTH